MIPVLDIAAWAFSALMFLGLGIILRHVRKLPDLPEPTGLESLPSVCLCIPARNEVREIGPALDSWLAQDYPALRILVVDDGSTDGTSEALGERAARHPHSLRAIRNDVLPPGWLGKNHALHLASSQPEALAAQWLLFADADVHADPGLLRRAFAFLDLHPADILALLPGIEAFSPAERLFLPFASAGFLALVPPDLVARPGSPFFCGVGAFTLVRREAYEAVDGHRGAPLEPIDDMFLARRVKRAGYPNRVARGGPLLHLRMYHGLGDMVRAMRKNALGVPVLWGLGPLIAAFFVLYLGSPLWLPWVGHPWLGFWIWMLNPPVVGEVHQRLTGRPLDWIWVFWPLIGLVFAAGMLWAFWDRLRGVNHWRGREVRLKGVS